MILLLPRVRRLPLIVILAAEPDTGSVPRVVLPSRNVTVPVGEVVPEAALIVAVTMVLAVETKLAGLAATVVVVATGGAVTATLTEPLEFEKLPVAEYFAVMVLLPTVRLLPLMVRLAVDPDRFSDPRVVLPRVKVTVPVGEALPLAALTVAVTVVLEVETIVAEFAETVVVVATEPGLAMVTVTAPLDPRNVPVGKYSAVITFAPDVRALPLIVMVAVAVEVPAVRGSEPIAAPSKLNTTVPVGGLVPLTAVTVAVI